MAARTTQGFITSTAAQIILSYDDYFDGPGHEMSIRHLTLYNPNATTSTFVLRKVVNTVEDVTSELRIRRYGYVIPATDTWAFGLTGTPVLLVLEHERYEVVLTATPTLGIEWCADIAVLA